MNNSNKQQKVYILLKDLPDAKSGTEILMQMGGTTFYIPQKKSYDILYRFTEKQLIDNPEWFKEKQQPIVEENKITVKNLEHFGDNYFFSLNKGDIFPNQIEAVKQAIEKTLNGEMDNPLPTMERQHSQWTPSLEEDVVLPNGYIARVEKLFAYKRTCGVSYLDISNRLIRDEYHLDSVSPIKASKEEQKPIPPCPPPEKLEPTNNKEVFKQELEGIINRYSMENGSDTPDYILAKYLSNCLEVFNDAVTSRDISKN